MWDTLIEFGLVYLDATLIYLFILFVGFSVLKNLKGRVLDYIVAILLAEGISEGIKYVFHTQRPITALYGLTFEGASFPSTHTAIAFTAAFFYYFTYIKHKNLIELESVTNVGLAGYNRLNSILIVIMFFVAFAICSLRIILGAHFFIDVLAGIILGFVVSFLISSIDIGLIKHPKV